MTTSHFHILIWINISREWDKKKGARYMLGTYLVSCKRTGFSYFWRNFQFRAKKLTFVLNSLQLEIQIKTTAETNVILFLDSNITVLYLEIHPLFQKLFLKYNAFIPFQQHQQKEFLFSGINTCSQERETVGSITGETCVAGKLQQTVLIL